VKNFRIRISDFSVFSDFGSPGKKEKGKETGPAWEYITTPDLFCSRKKGEGAPQ